MTAEPTTPPPTTPPPPPEAAPDPKAIPARTAWLRVAGVTVLLWVVLGALCFGVGTSVIESKLGTTLNAALVLDITFLVGAAIVVAVVVGWQRAHGETVRDLGWRAPTRPVAIVVAIIWGLIWTSSGYARGGHPLQEFLTFSWQRPIMMVIGLFLAYAEELAVRGFLMEQLRRGGVHTAVQVIVSGVIMGAYHGFIGGHYSIAYFIASSVIFAIQSLIFVLGRRSLTPVYISHAMTHFLGDPGLIRGILVGLTYMR